ncbi:proheparin-binding EGF-like growth factor [Latimeria chalumnae]|uniref:Proheparin-binding EGF-like growth factor n=1 Tax=Latimeria chalumnae TaxID=7897 RepID=H3AAZ6_LATCH|nr:PREDICTED: proheparin-binding EGF-like growth factor [Latimeria chalumnae]|eukprot:XP_006007931.1 PREDICTED: proheparin-binding EGF-like growth factor [Latimeria chalumnae]
MNFLSITATLILIAVSCCCRVNGAAFTSHAVEVYPRTAEKGFLAVTKDNLLEDYEDYIEDEELSSGDYYLDIFPRVAYSSKPKDLTIPSGREKVKRRRKGKGKKRDPCQRKYKDFCIHGECKYNRKVKAATCICESGYHGERCHELNILPVGNPKNNYSETTALAIVAVVLSSACLMVIAGLLALRCHRRGTYDVENEEKMKLRAAVNQ